MSEARWARLILWLSMLIGVGLRLGIIFGDEGIVWPDEVYQSFEPAHRLVFGYGLIPWEYIEGARTWALPGFVAFWLKLCALVGAATPFVYVRVVKVVFALLSLLAAGGAYRLARTLGAKPLLAAAGAAVGALAVVPLYFGHRAMSENMAAVLVVWGLALALEPGTPRRALVAGGSLLGLAVLFRLQAAVVCVGLVVLLAARTRAKQDELRTTWRHVLQLVGVLGVWALVFGALDAATWHDAPGAKAGGWFHSAVVYLRFNLIEGKAAGWGTSPPSYYAEYLFRSMPGVTLACAAAVLVSLRRATGVAVVTLVFFALHSTVAHKELRFILPILPVAFALVGVALDAVTKKEGTGLTRWAPLALVLLSAGWSAATSRSLTMGDIGSYLERGGSTAWDDFGNVNRLLLAASRQEDVCGLRVDVAHLAWTGGSTYLHHPAPLFMRGMPIPPGAFNYAITFPNSGAEVIAHDKGIELVRLPGTCTPTPGYTWRLP